MSLGKLSNAVTEEQRKTLLECCNDFRTRNYFLFRDDPVFETVKDIILPSIIKFEGKDNIYKAMFLNVDVSAGLHVDEYFDRNPRNTYIFPLGFPAKDPALPASTYTVVFHQKYFSEYKPTDERYDVSEFFETAPNVYPNVAKHAQEIIGNVPEEYRTKLSLEACLEWQLGDMLFFPRNQLHTSDNINLTNVARKQALTVFTTDDEIRPDMK
jgi:hypothetical protein